MKKRIFAILLIISALACKKDNDDQDISTDLQVKDFIWKGLNQYYLWQEDVPNLADNRFAANVQETNVKNASYLSFLNNGGDNSNFFYQLLNKSRQLNKIDYIDRFSYITDNYVELEQHFSGISLSAGFQFELSRYGNSGGVLGIVRYVVPNSNAERLGIERGDVFTSVDNTPMNLTNYVSLLSNDNTSITIDINKIQKIGGQSTIVPLNRSVTIVKTQLTENPILIKKVIEKNGHKIGYLMYNSFIYNFDQELNQVFAYFKNEGITDLVLDLRYNGGGHIVSAVRLASMITGQFTGKVFARERWNKKMQSIVEQQRSAENYFVDEMSKTPLNHLKMNKLYILTSDRTASASELVINGLKPYIEVIQIGSTTVGKNQGSITIYDEIDNNGTKNPNHKWAMQPITFKIENADGFSDYANGLVPSVSMEEDAANYGVLGDENEPFLAKAIAIITGNSGRITAEKAVFPIKSIGSSADFNIATNGMYK